LEVDEDDMVSYCEVMSQREEVRLDDWGLRCETLAIIHKPQPHLSNPYYVDEEFQEDGFIDEEFERQEDVEEPSQGFADWDPPPTCDPNEQGKDPKKTPLPFD
jgi:hypothetical protein